MLDMFYNPYIKILAFALILHYFTEEMIKRKIATQLDCWVLCVLFMAGFQAFGLEIQSFEVPSVSYFAILVLCYYGSFIITCGWLNRSIFGLKGSLYFVFLFFVTYTIDYLLDPLEKFPPINLFFSKTLIILLFTSWPNKPFAFKNIFNELSGDNALSRNNLQQNLKASTQCKC